MTGRATTGAPSVTRRAMLAWAAASAVGRGARAAPRTVLRVADQKGGAKSLMQAAGALDGIGYDVAWSLFAGAPMLLEALNAGAVDVGQIGDAPLSFAIAGRNRIRVIGAWHSDPALTALVVPAGSPIRSVRDLAGRSVATLRGQTGHYLTLAALKRAGLGADAVRFVFIPPSAAHVALLSGAVDSWASWGPYIAEAEIADNARRIVDGRGLMSGLGYVVATPDAIASRHAELADFCTRLDRARAWAASHPDIYARAWAAEIGLPLPVAQRVVGWTVSTRVPLDAETIARQQQVADFMHESHMLAAAQDVAPWFDRSFQG